MSKARMTKQKLRYTCPCFAIRHSGCFVIGSGILAFVISSGRRVIGQLGRRPGRGPGRGHRCRRHIRIQRCR